MSTVIDTILRQQSLPKFKGIFGAPLYTYVFSGYGSWNKNYSPTAQAFKTELTTRGYKNVSFSLNTNLGFIYIFTGSISAISDDVNAIKNHLQNYFAYYFNALDLTVSRKDVDASGNVSYPVHTETIDVVDNSNAFSASFVNLSNLQNQIIAKGFKNVIVRRVAQNQITVSVETTLSKTQAENIIEPLVRHAFIITSGATGNIANNTISSAGTTATALLNAAKAYANKTGVTLDKAVETITNGAIKTAAEVGTQVDKIDISSWKDIVNKVAVVFGVSYIVAALILGVFGLIFLKSYLGK